MITPPTNNSDYSKYLPYAIGAAAILGALVMLFPVMIIMLFASNSGQQNASPQQQNQIPFQELYQEIAIQYPDVPWNYLAAVHYYSPVYQQDLQALNQYGPATLKGKPQDIVDSINKYAQLNGLDPLLVAAVIQQESDWNIQANSHVGGCGKAVGARGLMQVMPCHFEADGINPDTPVSYNGQTIEEGYLPDLNIKYGTQILASCMHQFGDVKLALACYNAGAGAVQAAGNTVPVNGQTEDYVPAVLNYYTQFQQSILTSVGLPSGATKTTMDDVKKWLQAKAAELANLVRIQSDDTKNNHGACIKEAQAEKAKGLTIGTSSFPLSCAIYSQAPQNYKDTTDDQWNYVSMVEQKAQEFISQSTMVTFLGNAGPFAQSEIAAAEKWQGTPYSWGGGNPSGPTFGIAQGANTKGFDCSGLVLYAVYQASGGKITLPHLADSQARMGTPVAQGLGLTIPMNSLQPGDVIGFALDGGSTYTHIGIYIGNNQMVAAPKTGDVVKIEPINTAYWQNVPWKVVRFG